MSKNLSEKGAGPRVGVGAPTKSWVALIALLLSLFFAGCVGSGAASDDDKHPVFYGGVTGGGSWP
jgi:hypothetical protein